MINRKEEFPLWLSGLRTCHSLCEDEVLSLTWLTGLRIWYSCKLWHRLQMQLRSGMAVAVV